MLQSLQTESTNFQFGFGDSRNGSIAATLTQFQPLQLETNGRQLLDKQLAATPYIGRDISTLVLLYRCVN